MIKDTAVKASIDQQWNVIAFMLDHNKSRFIGVNTIATEQAPDTFYNLPLVLTYCTLECALAQLMDEGTIKSQKKTKFQNIKLKARMEAAKRAIDWKAYALVDEGRDARNKLAHEGKMLDKYTCMKYIHAIGDELKHWGIF
jgi:hypothetical protein